MIRIIKREIAIEKELRFKIEWACTFSNCEPKIKNGSLRMVEKSNIAYVEPHCVVVKDKLFLMDMVNDMDIKDKLRLAIRMSESDYTNLKYNKPEEYQYFDNKLKEIDEKYRTTIINFRKYFNVMFAMTKIMEMSKEDQNQVALYLFNHIKHKDLKMSKKAELLKNAKIHGIINQI